MRTLNILVALITLIATLAITFAQENHTMLYSEKLQTVQGAITYIADKHGIKINSIQWTHSEHSVIATINYKGLQKQLEFSSDELQKIEKNYIPIKTLNKIRDTISLIPGRDWPPGEKK